MMLNRIRENNFKTVSETYIDSIEFKVNKIFTTW